MSESGLVSSEHPTEQNVIMGLHMEEFMTECKLLGNKVLHSSCYNSQSQGLIERKVGVLKDLLKKSEASLSQLQLDELLLK